jgi:ADP-ribose pyrophosphatase YjhB (NUDIX family)
MTDPVYPFAIPVVRLILSDKLKRVLILERAGGNAAGEWCLPGGKLDYGETFEEVARRELREETDLELLSLRFLFLQDGLPTAPDRSHYLNLYFKCDWQGTIKLNSESLRHVWVARETISDYEIAFNNDEALRRYWNLA